MSWKSNNNESSVIHKKILEIINSVIKFVDFAVDKRFFINIILFLISVALITGFYSSTNNKEYWDNTFKTVTNETNDKLELIGNNFVDKAQNKLETSIQLAYSNSKDALNKKSFHQLPEINLRSKTSIIDIFTNKSFKTIDNSKKLRLGELKWKFFSKIQ